MKVKTSKWVLLLIAAFVVGVSASEHIGYWREPTPKGEGFKCRKVTTRDDMLDVLRRAGWDAGSEVPTINWRRQEAIVISPSTYYKSAYLSFYGLVREDGAMILKYGWEPIKSMQITGSNSVSLGSSVPGYAATIVVSYRRGLDSDGGLYCRNLGVVGR